MINASAIKILKTFSEDELNSFEEFLNSPFHNKNFIVIRFFTLLRHYHPEYASPLLTKEKLFEEMYGNIQYKESYIRNLFSDLNILEEKFLVIISLNDNFISDRQLIEQLNKRELSHSVLKKLKKFEKENNSNKARDQEFYNNKSFAYNIRSLLVVEKSLYDNFRKDEMLSRIKHFVLSVIEASFNLILEEQRVKIKHDFSFIKQTIDYMSLNLSDFSDSPLLMIFYYLWKSFFEDDDEKYFAEAKKLFKKSYGFLEKIDKKNIYSIMQAYYMIKIDKGSWHYEKELLMFLMEILKNNVLSHEKKEKINLNLYRNILIMCYRNNEISILSKFIPVYINYVDSGSRESISAYSYAHLNCLKKDFEKALTLCNEIDLNDLLKSTNENLYFKIDIRNLMLICLYELGSFENALFHIDSYRRFLSNSKLIKDKSKPKYLELLKLISELIRLNFNFNDYELMVFKKKLMNNTDIVSRAWLIEKSNELENAPRKKTSA